MKKWNKDYGLQFRMVLTIFLLVVVYLFFLALMGIISYIIVYNIMYISGISDIMIIFIAFMIGILILLSFFQFYSDNIALKCMGAEIITEQEEPHLHETVSRLCAIVDLPKPKIAIIKQNIPNAFTTGKNEKSAVIAVTTALMKELNQLELEAVIAHELSHIKNKDIAIITIASFLYIAVFFFAEKNKKFFETDCF
jgi:heat shock protein HtpX